MENNRLYNGRFLHDLDQWTASGALYSAGDGDDHYGVAVLSTGGDYVEQDFTVPHVRAYTLHLSVKPVGAALSGSQVTAKVTDGDGNTVVTLSMSGTADAWTDNTNTVGLAPGTTYKVRITNVSAAGDVKIDDVWLWPIPYARADLAARVHTRLGRLATERSLTTTPSGSLTEGSYTYAVDAGLIQVGALNPETDQPDVRWLDSGLAPAAIDIVEREMLEQLARDYAVEVDISAGPLREALSQKRTAIEAMLAGGGASGGTGRVVVKKLRYEEKDYEL